MNNRAILILHVTILSLFSYSAVSQQDTNRYFKNVIKVNVTNPMLFSPRYNVVGYERVIGRHQSASVSMGRFALSNFVFDDDSMKIRDNINDKGFNFSLDYRFYLKGENKYDAPRGVFLGPYYSYNYFKRELVWDLSSSSGFNGQVSSSIDMTANLVGAQMGYQFVLWNRLTVDMILVGPGLWFFKLKSEFNTTLDPDDEAMLVQKINELLQDRFPGSDYIFTGSDLEASKTTTTATMGLRYLISIGFRF
jgi:hypothetical protein